MAAKLVSLVGVALMDLMPVEMWEALHTEWSVELKADMKATAVAACLVEKMVGKMDAWQLAGWMAVWTAN